MKVAIFHHGIDRTKATRIVQFVADGAECDLSDVLVILRPHRGDGNARAYNHIPDLYSVYAEPHHRMLVLVEIPNDAAFPLLNLDTNSVSLAVIWDWCEFLVASVAHEFKHIWQFKFRKPALDRVCEKRAERWLEAYRRGPVGIVA